MKCPSCGEETISFVEKIRSSEKSPATCGSCGVHVFARETVLVDWLETLLLGSAPIVLVVVAAFYSLVVAGLFLLLILAAFFAIQLLTPLEVVAVESEQ